MSDDPIGQIEERQQQIDVGTVVGRVYMGARLELSRIDSLYVAAAWFKAMTAPDNNPEEESG